MFFFFQAEDGIRDVAVTGVQTCALPIYGLMKAYTAKEDSMTAICTSCGCRLNADDAGSVHCSGCGRSFAIAGGASLSVGRPRSEERRVGKECRSRWCP